MGSNKLAIENPLLTLEDACKHLNISMGQLHELIIQKYVKLIVLNNELSNQNKKVWKRGSFSNPTAALTETTKKSRFNGNDFLYLSYNNEFYIKLNDTKEKSLDEMRENLQSKTMCTINEAYILRHELDILQKTKKLGKSSLTNLDIISYFESDKTSGWKQISNTNISIHEASKKIKVRNNDEYLEFKTTSYVWNVFMIFLDYHNKEMTDLYSRSYLSTKDDYLNASEVITQIKAIIDRDVEDSDRILTIADFDTVPPKEKKSMSDFWRNSKEAKELIFEKHPDSGKVPKYYRLRLIIS